tara:strand:- start:466 stop:711 length:246 start_codon:yes stop_codon:yes gene_type:complete
LRRRSLSEEDELDELDELERPISLAPITAFPLQAIPQHENLQSLGRGKKALNMFDFPPFSPRFSQAATISSRKSELSAGIG